MADKSDDKSKLNSQFMPNGAMRGFEVEPYAEVSGHLAKLSAKTTDFVRKLDEEKSKQINI